MTDIHYGSIGVDYDRLNEHFDIVENTPILSVVIGRDTIDNFAIKHAYAGITGDAIPPQVQAQAFMEKLLSIDNKNKLGATATETMKIGCLIAGLDYYNTFMGDIKAPVFPKGGNLTTKIGSQKYEDRDSFINFGDHLK